MTLLLHLLEDGECGIDRRRASFVAEAGFVAGVGADTQRAYQRRERTPLPDQRDQYDDQGAEQQQVAIGEWLSVIGEQRHGKDRREADDAASAGPTQHDDLTSGESLGGPVS